MQPFVYVNMDIRYGRAVPSYPGGPLALARDIFFNNLTRVRRDFGQYEEPFLSFRQPTVPMVKGYTKNLRIFNREQARKRALLAKIEASTDIANLLMFTFGHRVQSLIFSN